MNQFSQAPNESGRDKQALSVTQLLRRMKNLLEIQIGEVWVLGEVSNLRKQASGHWYFSLKDEGAQVSCAMFGARNKPGAQVLADGNKIRVFAEASVYEARGQLQIIVQRAESAGQGDLQARFDALKRKLHAEGLFDTTRKKLLPPFPQVIGLVTSETGAALQDILNVINRRAPWITVVLSPVRVQGRGAETEIASAIRILSSPNLHNGPPCDLLIVGRGGGSLEDLWCFNEEIVARAIAACPLPVISAVGHEIDFTIADLAADVRAPTPSAAAELAVPDVLALRARLTQIKRRIQRLTGERCQSEHRKLENMRRSVFLRDGLRLLREPSQQLDHLRFRAEQAVMRALPSRVYALDRLKTALQTQHPTRILGRRSERVTELRSRLKFHFSSCLEERQQGLSRMHELLRMLGPESAFQRGFSIAIGPDGRALTSAMKICEGQALLTLFADGKVRSTVTEHQLPSR